MRILHLNEHYPPLVLGGAERSVATLAEAQVRAGHEVFVVCTTSGDFAEEVREGVTVFRIPHCTTFWSEDWLQHNGLERLWRKASMPFNRGQRMHFAKLLRQVQPDIVHTHSMNDVSTGAWVEAKRQGYPLIHTLRNYDLLCSNGAMYHNGLTCGPRCRLISIAKQRQHRCIDGVVGISAEVLQLHCDHGLFAHVPQACRRVIWNSARVAGADTAYLRPPRDGKPFAFGYLGRLAEEKGVGMLIEAARQLPVDRDWEMVIAGRAPGNGNPFSGAAAGLPVRFIGQVEPLALFEQVDVLVAPAIWPEPFGRIIVEAYSVGVPVLAADIGGMPGLILGDHTRWLVQPGDVDGLSDRMMRIMADGRAALPSGPDFDPVIAATEPDTIARAYESFYRTFVQPEPRAA
ncbi:glycosyltransferase family 4 protein [Sphingomonas sp. IC4-52]|uniref:glycosyltransferase family 4 protein n=1 Tax=Sphingomonas sp. IC4-52 TaxID=2887202 RepID=UPI001D11C3B5|nr:glycosyltransferase family 4 protein [Sphingomonas sp. IC4-52]MCC2980803.1 glycosyltransferase family 4 protein [Sphingomonas sp. IC4-52]